jgi:gas vesicle protein
MKSEESGAGFVAGFLLGGLVGAGLALLVTPRSGEETRDVLVDTGIELKVKAEEVVTKAREEADDLLARGKTILEEQKARVQEAVDVGKEAAAQKRSELAARYQVAKKEGEVPPAETLLP